MQIFVDQNLDNEISTTITELNNDDFPLLIGGMLHDELGTYGHFNGRMDEVKITHIN
jgi:hypothetical protein